jgi:hypothetical protein
MKRRNIHFVWSYSLGLLVLTGCIMTPQVLDTVLGPLPGTYYVEQQSGKLSYYQLAETRGEAGEWVTLNETGDWYVGPGFYNLDANNEWSWDEDSAGLTLDEFIQLYDPAPAAP